MKTVEQIKENLKTIDWIIANHKKQIEIYLNDEFNVDKCIEYSEKIKLLEVEKNLLNWVLDERF